MRALREEEFIVNLLFFSRSLRRLVAFDKAHSVYTLDNREVRSVLALKKSQFELTTRCSQLNLTATDRRLRNIYERN